MVATNPYSGKIGFDVSDAHLSVPIYEGTAEENMYEVALARHCQCEGAKHHRNVLRSRQHFRIGVPLKRSLVGELPLTIELRKGLRVEHNRAGSGFEFSVRKRRSNDFFLLLFFIDAIALVFQALECSSNLDAAPIIC